MAVHRVERNPSEHEDVRISVEHVVQKVAAGGRLACKLGDLPVEGVQVRVDEDQQEREAEEAASANVETDRRSRRREEPGPRHGVRIDANHPVCDRHQATSCQDAIAVEYQNSTSS